MADEVGVAVPEAPAEGEVPVPVLAEVPADQAPATEEQAPPETPAPKTFTQEELEAILGKRLALEKRKFERMIAAAAPPKAVEVKPFDTYASPEDFAKDVAAKAVETAEVQKAQTTEQEAFAKQVDKALEKYPDFEEVAFTHPFMTDDMAKVIRASPVATDLAYHLGKNLEEAERISSLSPVQQIRELVKLEVKLDNAPAKPKVSAAPAPIKPVGNRGTTDTSDPSKMSMEEYREFRKKAGATWAR